MPLLQGQRRLWWMCLVESHWITSGTKCIAQWIAGSDATSIIWLVLPQIYAKATLAISISRCLHYWTVMAKLRNSCALNIASCMHWHDVGINISSNGATMTHFSFLFISCCNPWFEHVCLVEGSGLSFSILMHVYISSLPLVLIALVVTPRLQCTADRSSLVFLLAHFRKLRL